MADDKIKKLYDTFVSEGYEMEPEADFRKNIQDSQKRRSAYDALVKEGYDMEPFEEFEGNLGFGGEVPTFTAEEIEADTVAGQKQSQAPEQAHAPVAQQSAQRRPIFDVRGPGEMLTPMAEPGKDRLEDRPAHPSVVTPDGRNFGAMPQTDEERKAASAVLEQSVENTRRRMDETVERQRRLSQARKGGSDVEQLARMRGDELPRLSVTRHVSEQAHAPVAQQGNALAGASDVRVFDYKFNPATGKNEARYLLPTGELTTDVIEAQRWQNDVKDAKMEHRDAFEAELAARNEYTRAVSEAIESAWSQAEEEERQADKEYYDKEAERATTVGGALAQVFAPGAMTPNEVKRQVKRYENFDLEKMAEQAIHQLKTDNGQLTQEEEQALRAEIYGALYQKAVEMQLPKSKTEFFLRKLSDLQVWNPKQMAGMAVAGVTGNYDLHVAQQEAMARYGREHKALDVVGGVGNMAADPLLYATGAIGGAARSIALRGVGKSMARKATGKVAERLAERTLAGRLIGGGVASGVTLGAFEGAKDVQGQLYTTGEVDAGQALERVGHGAGLGVVIGPMGVALGNVTDGIVKGISNTVGKAAARTGGVAVSTIAEGTVFAAPDIADVYMMSDEEFEAYKAQQGFDADVTRFQAGMDVWDDSMVFMLGLKAQGVIKSAPRVIEGLRPIKEPRTMAERNRNRQSFEERVRTRLDASPRDLDFTKEELDELRVAGYEDLGALFGRKGREKSVGVNANGTDKADGEKALVRQIDHAAEVREASELDGYEEMQRLMADRRVSQAVRAKAYWVVTGKSLPMGTVTGWNATEHEDGSVTVKSLTGEGEAVTSRTFRSAKEAEAEKSRIYRQAELNTVDMGERYRYAAFGEGAGDAPEDIRRRVKDVTGVDVDNALRKMPERRSEKERNTVELYMRMLYPNQESIVKSMKPQGRAKMKFEDREVDVMDGRVVMTDDGTMVDVAKSDKTIIVRDVATGKVEMVSPDAILSYGDSPLNSGEKDVTLQGENVTDNGEGLEQNHDERAQSWEDDGGAVVDDSAAGVAGNRDRGYIRVYEEGLAAERGGDSGSSERTRREQESERLIGIAHRQGQYVPSNTWDDLGERIRKPSGESIVFINQEQGRIYKVKNPYAKSPMKGRVAPEEAIFEHLVHNKYFPETAYGFEGVSDVAGDVRIVLSQDLVESADKATDAQIEAALAEKGLMPEGKYTYGNDEISVTDVSGDNALVGADGRVYFIDPVIDFKKPAREILGEAPTEGQVQAPAAEQGPAYGAGQIRVRDVDGKESRGWLTGEIVTAENYDELGVSRSDIGKYEYYLEGGLAGLRYATREELDDMVVDFKPDKPVEVQSDENAVNPTEKTDLEGESVPKTDVSVENGQQPSALERIPRNEKGEPVFEQAESPEHGWDALVEFSEGDADTAKAIAETMVEEKRKAFEKAQTLKVKGKTPMEIMQSKKANAAAVESARAEYEQWQGIASVEQERQATIRGQQEAEERRLAAERAEAEVAARQANEEEKASRPGMYAKVMQRWDEPKSVEEYILRALCSGGVKLRWSDSAQSATHGLGKHITGGDNLQKRWAGDSEYGQRRWMIDDRNGMFPEEFAEKICQEYYNDYENDTDHYSEVFGALLDVCLHTPTSRMMYERAKQLHHERKLAEAEADDEALSVMRRYNLSSIEEADFMMQYGVDYEQYETEMDAAAASAEEKALPEAEYSELLTKFAEDYIRQEEYERNRRNDSSGVQGIHSAGTSLLPGESSDDGRRIATDNRAGGPEARVPASDNAHAAAPEAPVSAVDEALPSATGAEPTDSGAGVERDSGLSGSGSESVQEVKAELNEAIMPQSLKWSNERAANGEPFLEDANGNIDLVDIAQEVFDKMGIQKAPFRLTPSMVAHVFERHRKELKLNTPEEAVEAILNVMSNFDHVRRGRGNTFVFSIEGNRTKSARRAITFVLEYDKGEWLGIKTFGYDHIANIQELTTLWEKGEKESSTTGVAPANVTSDQSSQGDQTDGIASNQSAAISDGKGNTLSIDKQISDDKSFMQPTDDKGAGLEKPSVQASVQAASAEVTPNPTAAQKEAGNYKKGHVTIGDFDITIENPAGSVRKGVDAGGKEWQTTMHNAYGYIKGTEGVDGDHIDVFLHTDMDEWDGRKVFVIDQYNPDGSFDEHKVMLGFNDKNDAYSDYLANYETGWANGRKLTVTAVNIEDFNKWIAGSHRKTKPFAEYAGVSRKAETSAESTQGEGYIIEPRKHTKNNTDIFAVKFERKVSKDEFAGQKAIAKKHGGYWSNFGKKGFLFKSEANAKVFAAEVMGKPGEAIKDEASLSIADINSVSNSAIQPHTAPKKAEIKPRKRSKWISDDDAAEFDNLRSGLRNHLGADDNTAHEDAPTYGKYTPKQMDAEVLRMGTRMTYLMMKGGLRKFSDYAEAMVDEVGDAIRPHLKSLYAAVQNTEEVIELGWDDEMDDRKTVKAFDVYNFDKPGAKDIIETAKHAVEEHQSQTDAEVVTQVLKDERNDKRKTEEGKPTVLQQWKEMKQRHPDALMLMRVGDFYELLGSDAEDASKILGITLTQRAGGDGKIMLAGFPHSALDSYLPKLVRAGNRVAICEQLEESRKKQLTKKVEASAPAKFQQDPEKSKREFEELAKKTENGEIKFDVSPEVEAELAKRRNGQHPEQGDLFGGLFDEPKSETDKIIIGAVEKDKPATPKPKPAEKLSGESAERQEQETKERDFVDDIRVEIVERVTSPRDTPLTMAEVRKMAKECGITDISATDLQELVERAISLNARTIAEQALTYGKLDPKEAFDRIVRLYQMQPNLTDRDSERVAKQQYSTPVPMGYVMNQFMLSNGFKGKSLLEPSAGNGALTIGVPMIMCHVNDIDARRLANLRAMGFPLVTNQDGTLAFKGEYDMVITNPPFGKMTPRQYGPFSIETLEGQMAINALESLKDNGRAAIIVGGAIGKWPTPYRENGSLERLADRQFFGYLYSHFNVVDIIPIDGKKLYSRNGTGYNVRMILIDGRRRDVNGRVIREVTADNRVYPPVMADARPEPVTTYDELYNRVQDDILRISQRLPKPLFADGGRRESEQRSAAPDTGRSDSPRGERVQQPMGDDEHGGTSGSRLGGMHSQGETSRGYGGRTEPNGTGQQYNADAGGGDGSTMDARGTSDSGKSNGRRGTSVGATTLGHEADRMGQRSGSGNKRLTLTEQPVKVTLTDEKVASPHISEANHLMSRMPAAQAMEFEAALKGLEARHGNIDEWLVDELGYANTSDLWRALAAEQVEGVAMAIDKMESERGFIIADQTGIGKGRQAASIIRYAIRQGKKPIFFTQKPGLFSDMYRDLCDIGSTELRPFIFGSDNDANITVRGKDGNDITVFKRPTKSEFDRVFAYIEQQGELPPEYDYAVITYSQINTGTVEYDVAATDEYGKPKQKIKSYNGGVPATAKAGQRRRNIVERLAEDNYIILDESHTAGGQSGTGGFMQTVISGVRGVTYLSATYAKRPDNMPLYAIKTAISESGVSTNELIGAVSKGGVPLQEIMSRQLVKSGEMVRRERDFTGVSIDWVETDTGRADEQRKRFDIVSQIFADIMRFQDQFVTPAIKDISKDQAALGGVAGLKKGTKAMGVDNVPFASKLYNMIQQLLFSIKVDAIADRAIKNLEAGRKPIISFANTMEGYLELAHEEYAEGKKKMPTLALSLQKALDGVMRYTVKDADNKETHSTLDLYDMAPDAVEVYNNIMSKINAVSEDLPIAPLDAIRMKIEEAGFTVRELSGRELELAKNKDGLYVIRKRGATDKKAAAADFNDGSVDVLLINKTGSTGISLHASERFGDKRQRVMIAAQFQPDVNDEVQMRGRIDRTGQVLRGAYEYLLSCIPAEQRLQMMFKAKLKSLDANTTSSQKSSFNEMEIVDVLNKYGDEIVYDYLMEDLALNADMGNPLNLDGKELQREGRDDTPKKEGGAPEGFARKALGRLALLNIQEQERVMSEISDRYLKKIKELDERGENDLEITSQDLKAKTLSKEVWVEGSEPEGNNAFADNVYCEKVDVNILAKPMKLEEVKGFHKTMLDEAGVSTWDEFIGKKRDEINVHYDGKNAEIIERVNTNTQQTIERRRKKMRGDLVAARQSGKNSYTDEQIEKMVEEKVGPDELQAARDRIEREKSRLNYHRKMMIDRMERFKAMQPIAIPENLTDESRMSLEPSMGVLVGIKFDKKFSLSGTQAIFAPLDGRRSVSVTFKEANTAFGLISQSTMMVRDVLGKFDMERDWNNMISKDTREERYMLTGNILRALVDSQKTEKARGRIMTYTTEDGEVKTGILMPPKFEPTDLQNETPIGNMADAIRKGIEVKSSNGEVIVRRSQGWRSEGPYELLVPKSKAKGGKYYLDDRKLLSLVVNKFDIPRGGNNAVAYISELNLDKVLKHLSTFHKISVMQQSKLGISKENGNFAKEPTQRYETEDGKEINYTSEQPGGYYGNLFDFDFSAENARSNAVDNGAGANGIWLEDNPGRTEPGSGLNRADGEFAVVERVFKETGSFNFMSGERIESADDVAFIFSALEDAAKEHTFAVFVKDGKPTVVELGMGAFNASIADIPTASLAYNRIKPDEVYFVHNHPSGNLKCSTQDAQLLQKMQDMCDVPVYGVIINLKTGKYGTFDTAGRSGEGLKSNPATASALTIYTLDKQIFSADYDPLSQPLVRSSADVAAFLNSHRMGDRAKVSFLILSQSGHIVGNIHTPFTDISTGVRDKARYVSDNVIQFGGASAILYGDFDMSNTKGRDYRRLREQIQKTGNIRLLDVVSVEGNHTRSANDEGLLYEPGSEYGVSANSDIRFREVEDDKVLTEFAEGKTVKAYRTMQVIEGKLYSPMATKVGGKTTPEIKLGIPEQSEEHPEIIKGTKMGKDGIEQGYVVIDKGLGKGTLTVAYNPYAHTSRTVLNDQFSSAYIRPNLVTVEVEVPESELTSGYRAHMAKDAVGEISWHSGSVSGQLAALGKPRRVILTRYDKPVRIVPFKEVAEMIAAQLDGTDIAIPYNVVQPQLRTELERLGVAISEEATGSVSDAQEFGKAEYITDQEIERINAHQQEMAQTSPEAKSRHAEKLSKKFNTPIRIVEDPTELTHDDPEMQKRMRGSKGFYNPTTGEVVVVVPNNASVEDVAATFFHEVVAHKGLRELIGDEGYDAFCDEVYDHLKDDLKSEVETEATRIFMHEPEKGFESARRKAMDEKFGRLSEKGFEDFTEAERGIWAKLKAKVLEAINKFLGSLKLPKWVRLGDNELRYMLWKSHERLSGQASRSRAHTAPNYVDMARDVAKRQELGLEQDVAMRRGVGHKKMSNTNEARLNDLDPADVEHSAKVAKKIEATKSELKQLAKTYREVTDPKGFLTDLGQSLGAVVGKSGSGYRTFELMDGSIVKVRISTHNANAEHAKAGEPVVSIVIKPKRTANTFVDEPGKKVSEYVYFKEELRKAPAGTLSKIAEGLSDLLETGKYEDTTGLARENHSEELRFRDGETGDIWKDRSVGLEERITNAAIRLAQNQADDLTLRNDAMRAVTNNLQGIRRAMSAQRRYDRSTAKRVADLARILIQHGYLDGMTGNEVMRLLSAVKNATGKVDSSTDIEKVVDIMIGNQLRNAEGTLKQLLAIKGSKADARGVEVQGKLDVEGQDMMAVVKEAMTLKEDDLNDQIAEALNRMSDPNATIADQAAIEYAGLNMALEYVQNIAGSKAEEQALRNSLRTAKEDKDAGRMTDDAYKQFVEATEDAIRKNRIERTEAYFNLVGRLSDSLRGSIENAKAFREAEKKRISEIHHNANSDMEGRPSNEHHKDDWKDKLVNNAFVQFLFAPLATFDQVLRVFGNKSANGEGYLWNRFMRGWVECRNRELTGVKEKFARLDAKAAELFGKSKTWGSIIRMESKLPKATIKFWDGGEMRDHELTQGNLMYIYMVDKMSDGRMKLRRMGITEQDVDAIERKLDPRFKELADWLQEEFLVDTRNEYNETHKRMFGASMAAIENYFPLKILANARIDKEEDVNQPNRPEGITTKTGSIIKRRVNNLALDITGADALSVILDHVTQMEHWNAYAEWNRDLNTLRTYKRFRNQVINMTTVYGGGRKLWENFNNLCLMAAGEYRPPVANFDKSAVNIAKGVTAAKVSLRMFTALKQVLSAPAYASEVSAMAIAKSIANPYGDFKWCMENMPIFRERWHSRISGDPRLLKNEKDWSMWRNRVMEICSRIGMTPNAFVDAVTVAIGARAMYETRLKQYVKEGYPTGVAEERAKEDATILFNQTQQSSESPFLSTMQVDRSWMSTMFTVFRNSSMSYTRQEYDALRNLKRNLTPGQRAESIEFMTKQMLRDWGMEPESADADSRSRAHTAAKRRFYRQLKKDVIRTAVFGFGLQLLWNLGPYLLYLFFGDDDDKKDEMWDDALTHAYFGSVEGLTGGDVMSAFGNMAVSGEWNANQLTKDMPIAGDINNIVNKFAGGKNAEAITDIANLLIQSGIGMNPQNITDGVVAIMDACGDDPALAHEAAILIMRVLQVPQSQLDNLYFDEIGLSGEEASKLTPEQLAERYAEYKVKCGTPLMPWTWDDEERLGKYQGRAEREIKNRLESLGDAAVNEAYVDFGERSKVVGRELSDARQLMKEDYIEGAKAFAFIQQNPDLMMHRRFSALDKRLTKLTKMYLKSKTPEQAAVLKDAVVKYRSGMVDALEAKSEAEMQRELDNLSEIYDGACEQVNR